MVTDARCPTCGGVKRPNGTTRGEPWCSCAPRLGCATLSVGRERVTLDPLLPRDEFDRRKARWDELSAKAFGQ